MKNLLHIILIAMSILISSNYLNAEWIEGEGYQFKEHNIANFTYSKYNTDSLRFFGDSSITYFDIRSGEFSEPKPFFYSEPKPHYYMGKFPDSLTKFPVAISSDKKNALYFYAKFSPPHSTNYSNRYYTSIINIDSNELTTVSYLLVEHINIVNDLGGHREGYPLYNILDVKDSLIVSLGNTFIEIQNMNTKEITHLTCYAPLKHKISNNGRYYLFITESSRGNYIYIYDANNMDVEEIYYSKKSSTGAQEIGRNIDFSDWRISNDGEFHAYLRADSTITINFEKINERILKLKRYPSNFSILNDGNQLVVAYSNPLEIEFYESYSGKFINGFTFAENEECTELYDSEDGNIIIASNEKLYKFDVNQFSFVDFITSDRNRVKQGEFVNFIAILPDGAEIIEWYDGNSVRIEKSDSLKKRIIETGNYAVGLKYELDGNTKIIRDTVYIASIKDFVFDFNIDNHYVEPPTNLKIKTGIIPKDYPELFQFKLFMNGNLVSTIYDNQIFENPDEEFVITYPIDGIGELDFKVEIQHNEEIFEHELETVYSNYTFTKHPKISSYIEFDGPMHDMIGNSDYIYASNGEEIVRYNHNFEELNRIEIEHDKILLVNDKIKTLKIHSRLNLDCHYSNVTKFLDSLVFSRFDVQLNFEYENVIKENEKIDSIKFNDIFYIADEEMNEYLFILDDYGCIAGPIWGNNLTLHYLNDNSEFQQSKLFHVQNKRRDYYISNSSVTFYLLNFFKYLNGSFFYNYNTISYYYYAIGKHSTHYNNIHSLLNNVNTETSKYNLTDYLRSSYEVNVGQLANTDYFENTKLVDMFYKDSVYNVLFSYTSLKMKRENNDNISILSPQKFFFEGNDMKFEYAIDLNFDEVLVFGSYYVDNNYTILKLPQYLEMHPGIGIYDFNKEEVERLISFDGLRGNFVRISKIGKWKYAALFKEKYRYFDTKEDRYTIKDKYFAFTYEHFPTSIKDSKRKIAIYPNPSNDYIYLDFEDDFELNSEIKIFNVMGACVITEKMTPTFKSIDITNLPKGVYFLRIGSLSEKFVKW